MWYRTRVKKFVGLLSDEDAELLERYATQARRILEFGAGGSTHIMSQAAPADARIVTVESDPAWIARVRQDLAQLGMTDRRVRFVGYDVWTRAEDTRGPFDLIFVDGASDRRLDFATAAWPRLTVGGVMLFHDTRNLASPRHLDNAFATVRRFLYEVDELRLNEKWRGRPSNLTAIVKKHSAPWIDWTRQGDRPAWRFGRGAVPPSFWRRS